MQKINAWFIEHHQLTLVLMSVFTALAVGIGAYLAIFHTDMDYFLFLGYLIVPVILAIYFRLMYGKYQEAQKREKHESTAKKS